MLSVLPVLSNCSSVEIHPSIYIFAIFYFEPMLCLSLGVGKMMEKCIVLMLGDNSRLASAVRCVNGSKRPFIYI